MCPFGIILKLLLLIRVEITVKVSVSTSTLYSSTSSETDYCISVWGPIFSSISNETHYIDEIWHSYFFSINTNHTIYEIWRSYFFIINKIQANSLDFRWPQSVQISWAIPLSRACSVTSGAESDSTSSWPPSVRTFSLLLCWLVTSS